MSRAVSRLGILAAGAASLLAWSGGCSRNGGDLTGDSGVLRDTVPPILEGFAGPSDTLRFATLNMSIGFPVSQLIGKRMDLDSIAFPELSRLDSLYRKGRPGERVRHMARVAAADAPEVIGLQEVLQFRRVRGSDTLSNDFLAEFQAELYANGGPVYRAYFQRLNDSLLSAVWKGDSLSIHFSEGNALLVREDVAILDTGRSLYRNLLFVPIPGNKPTERGYIYARLLGPKGALAEVYITHLEVLESTRLNQASELKLRILREKRDHHAQVILGDLNAAPDTNAYNILVKDAAFFDPFREAGGGATCCVANSELWNPSAAFSNVRIDYVLGKAVLGASRLKVLLDSTFTDSTGQRRFASDHRMVAASLALPVYPLR